MAETKSTVLTVRVNPEVKEGLRAAAGQEQCGLANMIEVMIHHRHDQRLRPRAGGRDCAPVQVNLACMVSPATSAKVIPTMKTCTTALASLIS